MGKTLRRYRDRTPAERRAVARAGLLITAFQVALAVLPFRRVMRMASGAGRTRRTDAPSQFDRDLAVWAVEAAGRRLLSRNPCLPKALAALTLFRRAGVDADLFVGVAREEEGRMRAHAWVESEGRVVVGGDVPLEAYTRLPGLDAKFPGFKKGHP